MMNTPIRRLTVLLAALLTIACGDASNGLQNDPDPGQNDAITLKHQRLTEATGISGDPDGPQRYVLDGETGIFEMDEDGALTLIWERPSELPVLTDLCAIGGGRFIAAADGDGYVIDLASGAARQHFCLEPGWDPGFDDAVRHLNRSVACDLENRLIYGQPRTVPQEGEPLPIRAEIASYSLVSGNDLQWFALPNPEFYAGGMTILPGGRILLGTGSELYIFDPSIGVLVEKTDLSSEGIGDIAGLSYHPQSGQLTVLDDDGQRVHTLLDEDIDLSL